MPGLAHKRLPGSQFAGLGRIKSWCNKHLAPRVCGRGDELMCIERLGPCLEMNRRASAAIMFCISL